VPPIDLAWTCCGSAMNERAPSLRGYLGVLKSAHLIAPDSPRQAFYHLRLEQTPHSCRVVKASGAGGRVWHQQVWEFATLAQAEAMFAQRLREKTNPSRRRRQYLLQDLLPTAGPLATQNRGHL